MIATFVIDYGAFGFRERIEMPEWAAVFTAVLVIVAVIYLIYRGPQSQSPPPPPPPPDRD